MNKNEEDKEPVDPKIVDSVKDQYFSQLNKNNFVKYLTGKGLKPAEVRKVVLLVEGCTAYDEAKNLSKSSSLKKLIDALKVDILLLDFKIDKV